MKHDRCTRWSDLGFLAAGLLLASCTELSADPLLVGLAGRKYRRMYASVVEKLGAAAETISGQTLEDPARMAQYRAVVIVSRGDPAQDQAGLSPQAATGVQQYIQSGGRVLFTLGCLPPDEVLPVEFGGWGWGLEWRVVDNEHPITHGMQRGQIVRYNAYRGWLKAVGENGRVLLAEPDGRPAVIAVSHGAGEAIYVVGDLGPAGSRDGTTEELRDRMLRYLLYSRVQDRFGPPLAAPAQPRLWPRVQTARKLVVPKQTQGSCLLRVDLSSAGKGLADGYELVATRPREPWTISAPPGRHILSPWLCMDLGSAAVQPGRIYRLRADACLTGTPSTARVRLVLRFYDDDGRELAHEKYAAESASPPGQWRDVAVTDRAPAQGASARVELSMMLPSGQAALNQVCLEEALTPEAHFAAEPPLETAVKRRPRLAPESAADLRVWVGSEETGVFGASRASIFAAVRKRADRYLAEKAIEFPNGSLPWPPTAMPEGRGGTAWNPMRGALCGRLMALAFAYRGTGDERYASRCIELLLAVSKWSQWWDPANRAPSLDIGGISIGAAFAHDFCHDAMSTEQRRSAAEAIRRNALEPLYTQLTGGRGNLNCRALWTSAMGFCAIATLDEVAGAATCVRAAEDFMLERLDLQASENPLEGMGYDSWSQGLLLTLMAALKRNCGAGHFNHPYLSVISRFAVSFLANDRKHTAWFEDAGGTTSYVYWQFPLTILGAVSRDPLAGWYLQETGRAKQQKFDTYKLLFFDPRMPVAAPDSEAPGAVFPRVGWAALRSGWERGGTFIAFICSDSGTGHAQRAQNHFLIYRDGTLLTADPGYASGRTGAMREFTRGTVGHNSVLVHGRGQQYKLGRVPYFATSRRVDYVMGDATAAYSSSLMERFHRHLVYLKPDLLLIVDDLRAAGHSRTFQWVLHPNGRLWTSEVTRAGEPLAVGAPSRKGDVLVVNKGKRMRVRLLHPSGAGYRYVEFPGAEKFGPYLQLDLPESRRATIVTLIELGKTKLAGAQAEVSNAGVTLAGRAPMGRLTVALTFARDGGGSPKLAVQLGAHTLLNRDALECP